MQILEKSDVDQLLAQSIVKPRLKRELHFKPDTHDFTLSDFMVVTTKSPTRGVLIIPVDDGFSVIPFEMSLRVTDTVTGRSKPVICDFCFTWQAGQSAGRVSLTLPDGRIKALLACGDLNCSKHVRGLTQASRMSRAQLAEHLDADDRIARLSERLRAFTTANSYPVTPLQQANGHSD